LSAPAERNSEPAAVSSAVTEPKASQAALCNCCLYANHSVRHAASHSLLDSYALVKCGGVTYSAARFRETRCRPRAVIRAPNPHRVARLDRYACHKRALNHSQPSPCRSPMPCRRRLVYATLRVKNAAQSSPPSPGAHARAARRRQRAWCMNGASVTRRQKCCSH